MSHSTEWWLSNYKYQTAYFTRNFGIIFVIIEWSSFDLSWK